MVQITLAINFLRTCKWLLNDCVFLQTRRLCYTENSSFVYFDDSFFKITPHNFTRLTYSLNPIPTIHPLSIPRTQDIIPTSSRPPPRDHVFQPDQISIYEEKFRI